MALFSNGILVQGPRPHTARRYGLLDVLEPRTPTDGHWMIDGVNWEDFLCTSVEAFIDVCPPTTGHIKSKERDLNFCTADPFQVKGSFDCSVGGRVRRYNAGEAFEIARQRLLQWEGHQVEETFWTGLAVNGEVVPSLALDPGCATFEDITPVAGAVDPVAAIASLEQELTQHIPNGGVIHIPYGLAAYLANFNLLVEDGGRYVTPTGNLYVIGSGYPGSGPGNVAANPGETWIFATGPVGVWRSNVFVVPNELSEAVDRSINDVTVYAERYYAVGFSCAVLAINVDLTCVC